MDDVDGNNDSRRGGLRLGDDGVGVRADANIVIVVMDEDRGGRGWRHAAWIKQQQLLH